MICLFSFHRSFHSFYFVATLKNWKRKFPNFLAWFSESSLLQCQRRAKHFSPFSTACIHQIEKEKKTRKQGLTISFSFLGRVAKNKSRWLQTTARDTRWRSSAPLVIIRQHEDVGMEQWHVWKPLIIVHLGLRKKKAREYERSMRKSSAFTSLSFCELAGWPFLQASQKSSN